MTKWPTQNTRPNSDRNDLQYCVTFTRTTLFYLIPVLVFTVNLHVSLSLGLPCNDEVCCKMANHIETELTHSIVCWLLTAYHRERRACWQRETQFSFEKVKWHILTIFQNWSDQYYSVQLKQFVVPKLDKMYMQHCATWKCIGTIQNCS